MSLPTRASPCSPVLPTALWTDSTCALDKVPHDGMASACGALSDEPWALWGQDGELVDDSACGPLQAGSEAATLHCNGALLANPFADHDPFAAGGQDVFSF